MVADEEDGEEEVDETEETEELTGLLNTDARAATEEPRVLRLGLEDEEEEEEAEMERGEPRALKL